MRSSVGIDVAAPPDIVFQVARDVARWAAILPHYDRSRVVRHEAGALVIEFVARRPLIPWLGLGLPVVWRSRVWDEPLTRRLRFVHLAGATAGMDVTWTVEPTPDGGTRIDIEHDFRRRLPVPWLGDRLGDEVLPAFIDRWFTRPIAGRTLATVRALAEALARVDPSIGVPP
jgi:carbon monoxide dehydrogenase subunit G